MYKLLIVDDEALARIGLQTMIENLFSDSITVVGSAQNGKEAIDLIFAKTPDIVITDIHMPVMNGLELARHISENPPLINPLFIFLTSYEDFHYLRDAIKYHAYDYLLKMEFNRDILSDTFTRAFQSIDSARQTTLPDENYVPLVFINRFYHQLLNGMYKSEEEIWDAATTYEQSVYAASYITAGCHIAYSSAFNNNLEKQSHVYLGILNSLKTSLGAHIECFITAYDYQTFGLLFLLEETELDEKSLFTFLEEARGSIQKYFAADLLFGIGKNVQSIAQVSASYYSATQTLSHASSSNPILFFDSSNDSEVHLPLEKDFIDRKVLNQNLLFAIEHCNITLFQDTLDSLIKNVATLKLEYAISLISGVVHLIINCLEEGERILTQSFYDEKLSYQSLYFLTSPTKLQNYLIQIKQYITLALSAPVNAPKQKLVADAKEYVKTHLYDKLSLSDVAKAINISPNYLSSLFKSHNNVNLTDYITMHKIEKAQELLKKDHLKIYQVSEKLGFESPQYFSKVYKKYTGHSPSELLTISNLDNGK